MASRIRGKERFRRILKAIPDKQRDRIKPALMAGAQIIVGIMRDLCPVQSIATLERTPGALRNTIHAERGGNRRGKFTTQDPDLTVTISAGAPPEIDYAAHVEWGTKDTPAQPYFYPGYRAGKRPALRLINKAARQAIKESVTSAPSSSSA